MGSTTQDYSIGLMTEYIAEMSSRLVLGAAPSVKFRTLVHYLLASFCLPEATVLLGMVYFSRWLAVVNKTPNTKFVLSEVEGWRLLVVAIRLGHKYLDDHPFDDHSWAAISRIPKAKLNMAERKWLADVHWDLFAHPDRNEDYISWMESWRGWLGKKLFCLTQSLQAASSLPAADAAAPGAAPFWAPAQPWECKPHSVAARKFVSLGCAGDVTDDVIVRYQRWLRENTSFASSSSFSYL